MYGKIDGVHVDVQKWPNENYIISVTEIFLNLDLRNGHENEFVYDNNK